MFPEPFIDSLVRSMGNARADALVEMLGTLPPVTIRLNPYKIPLDFELSSLLPFPLADDPHIPYSKSGLILKERPNFTLDPAFQAGAYYVQEASSMAIEIVEPLLRKMQGSGIVKVLDLCAAPGGKSTHILSMLRSIPDSFLVSNEVIRSRAAVLSDNIAKWGAANAVVTNNDPADFKVLPSYFDAIFVDAPCSGEGMFRKDPDSVEEWSEDNVQTCAARQRRILGDIWGSLKDGGLLVYSTCTFNPSEDDENVAWMSSTYGAEPLITEHLYPGREYGEGFFFSVLRKNEGIGSYRELLTRDKRSASLLKQYKGRVPFVKDGYRIYQKGNLLKAYPEAVSEEMLFVEQRLRTLAAGTAVATLLQGRQKGDETLIPEPDLAQSEVLNRAFPEVELYDDSLPDPREKALKYLRRDTISFPDAPNGYLLLTWKSLPLGFVKNIGNRCNNLWPQSRRILR